MSRLHGIIPIALLIFKAGRKSVTSLDKKKNPPLLDKNKQTKIKLISKY